MSDSDITGRFHKVNTLPQGLVKGHVYFVTSTGTVHVANSSSADDADCFSGVTDVSYDGSTGKLSLVTSLGETVTVSMVRLSDIGDVSAMRTSAKTVVGAINELYGIISGL